MSIEAAPETTLRDTLSEAFDEHVPDTPAETPAPTEAAPATPETPEPEQKPGRTAGRARDEKGQLLPGKAVKTEPAPVAEPAAVVAPVAPAITRPSSWKKDHWDNFDKIAKESPEVAKYILQREQEFASGISTYKREFDHVKPIMDAVQPYLPMYQQHGIDPGQQFAKYAEIHKSLALGSEDQKLGMLLRLAQDYRIPVEKLFVQKDGQMFYNPQVQAVPPHQEQQQFNPQMIEKTVQGIVAKERTAAEIAAMSNDTTKFPHFEAVRNTMAQLLDAGVAADLPSAYESALALPQHRELTQAALAQAQATEEATRKAKATAEAQRARQSTVSPRSATPAAKNGSTGKKELRSQLEDAFDEHVGGARA